MYLAIVILLLKLASADVILATKNGPVQGSKSQFAENVEAFLGIPYAEPPIGDFRFAKPIPKKNWSDTLIASKMPPPCPQIDFMPYYFMPDLTNMSEDCLYLNLWVPKSKYDYGLRPVIVYIHHGAFMTGAANQYDGSKIASRGDVIFAVINYRVGAFGFFLANVEEAPGNMGMYDQVMAMNWIKDNAEVFGGDPENIVLMGESAGAVFISAHMVSPVSKHLFKRVILQSGSMVHSFFKDNSRLLKNAKMVTSIVGCTNDTVNLLTDPQSSVKCLKRKPLESILAAEKTLMKSNPMPFFPRVNDEFLPKYPTELFREGKFRKDVDVLLGVNRDEGTMFLTTALPEYFGHYGQNNTLTMTKSFVKLFFRSMSVLLGMRNFTDISNFYLSNVKNQTSTEYLKAMAEVAGDFVLGCSTVFQADLLSLKGNKVHFYLFAFRAASTPMADWVGVTHLDELQYILGVPFHDNFTAEEIKFSNHLMDRWSSFARTGNPNVAGHMPWLRYSYHNPLYLNFGQEDESLHLHPLDRRCDVWRKHFKTDIDKTLIQFLRNSGLDNTS